MPTEKQQTIILDKLLKEIELPEHAYDKACKRYEDIGKWLEREESSVNEHDPHIFPQGSFRIGTAIRPMDNKEEYDLDLACKLRKGITKDNITQEAFKKIIGDELEKYRIARGIEKKLKTKRRCWCLEYKDDIRFHMDIVPCIPTDEEYRERIFKSILDSGEREIVARDSSQTTVCITDERHPKFESICVDWKISNPEGYAKWFEYRMYINQIQTFSERAQLAKAQIDEVPLFKRKTPLQRVIQLLKRHRDCWCKLKHDPEVKPISIIITTLAARAYSGETDIINALNNVLQQMENFINKSKPKVPNPVDPKEDFADKWYRKDCLNLKLENNFFSWLNQAKVDFKHIISTVDPTFIREFFEEKFSLKINEAKLKDQLGISGIVISSDKYDKIDRQKPAKPWRC